MSLRARLVLLISLVFKLANCDLIKLEVLREIDLSYSPVILGVQERSGNNLTLSCELISSDASAYDDQITWGKATKDLNFKNETDLELLARSKSPKLFELVQQSQDFNKAIKSFVPLHADDQGTYFCGSIKYMKFKVIHIVVTDETNTVKLHSSLNRNENFYCNEKMFKCKSGVGCIGHNFVCDKRPDCMDGSDESVETCKGDPCAEKLQCADGRCIPTSWCCDRLIDAACNVTYRPPCCPRRAAAANNDGNDAQQFEEYSVPTNAIKSPRTRYVIITIFIVATSMGIVMMLLLMSKLLLYAKKSAGRLQRHHHDHHGGRRERFPLDECAIPMRLRRPPLPLREDNNNGGGTLDLLILSDDILRRGVDDRPPSYSDVVVMDAPPPYTSQDCLNR